MPSIPLPTDSSAAHSVLSSSALTWGATAASALLSIIPSALLDRQTLSDLAGSASFTVWLFAQSPQILENYRRGSVDGLSGVFLAQWMLGDITNLVGCILTKQLPFQIAVATYFCCIDLCIVVQYIYYWNKAPREKAYYEGSYSIATESQRVATDGTPRRPRWARTGSDASTMPRSSTLASLQRGGGKQQYKTFSPSSSTASLSNLDRRKRPKINTVWSAGDDARRAAAAGGGSIVLSPQEITRGRDMSRTANRVTATSSSDPFISNGTETQTGYFDINVHAPPAHVPTHRAKKFIQEPDLADVAEASGIDGRIVTLARGPSGMPTHEHAQGGTYTTSRRPSSQSAPQSRSASASSSRRSSFDEPPTSRDPMSQSTIIASTSSASRAGKRSGSASRQASSRSGTSSSASNTPRRVRATRTNSGIMLLACGLLFGLCKSASRPGNAERAISDQRGSATLLGTSTASIYPATPAPAGSWDVDFTSARHPKLLYIKDSKLSPQSKHTSPDPPPTGGHGGDHQDEGEAPPSWERIVGRINAWICMVLYMTSRLPQIWVNMTRRSVEGLSILLFLSAFMGNLLYTISILVNPQSTGPGGREYLAESIPFLLGSGGTLIFDMIIMVQWIAWRGNAPHPIAYIRKQGRRRSTSTLRFARSRSRSTSVHSPVARNRDGTSSSMSQSVPGLGSHRQQRGAGGGGTMRGIPSPSLVRSTSTSKLGLGNGRASWTMDQDDVPPQSMFMSLHEDQLRRDRPHEGTPLLKRGGE